MTVRDALAGMRMLQQSFENISGRKEARRKQASTQKFVKEERVEKQEFAAGESALGRASAEKRSMISVGPAHRRITEAMRIQANKEEAAVKGAETIRGGIQGQTLKGELAAIGLEGGAMNFAQAAGKMESGEQLIMDLNAKLATKPNDPVLRKTVTDLTETYMRNSEQRAYMDAKSKAYAKSLYGPSAAATYNAGSNIRGIRDALQNGKFSGVKVELLPGYDLMDTDVPLSEYIKNMEEDDPTWKWSQKRGMVESSLTQLLMKTDPIFENDYNAANYMAGILVEKIFANGMRGLLKPQFMSEEGKTIEGKYKGGYDIPFQRELGKFYTDPSWSPSKSKGGKGFGKSESEPIQIELKGDLENEMKEYLKNR